MPRELAMMISQALRVSIFGVLVREMKGFSTGNTICYKCNDQIFYFRFQTAGLRYEEDVRLRVKDSPLKPKVPPGTVGSPGFQI